MALTRAQLCTKINGSCTCVMSHISSIVVSTETGAETSQTHATRCHLYKASIISQ